MAVRTSTHGAQKTPGVVRHNNLTNCQSLVVNESQWPLALYRKWKKGGTEWGSWPKGPKQRLFPDTQRGNGDGEVPNRIHCHLVVIVISRIYYFTWLPTLVRTGVR